jgi:hypothetical protein
VSRAEKCLGCHLGDSTRSVDHELIAAGHPDLYFELNSFTAVMPSHWKEMDKDPFYDLRLLATGQGVALRENLKRISRNASKFWPEYAELDCFTCHHSLVGAKDSWRQARGYPDRRPGNPPWNSSRYTVYRVILNQVDHDSATRLEAGIKRVDDLVSDIRANPSQIAQAAEAASGTADEIAKRMPKLQMDGAAGWKLIKAITASSDRIAGAGERSAEQAAMVLDSLFVASNGGAPAGNGSQVGAAITALFPLVENPSAYNPNSFAQQMRRVGALVP